MTSGDADQGFSGSSVTEYASELTAAADDAAETLSAFTPREQPARPKAAGTGGSIDVQMLMEIPVTMKVVVGSGTLPVSDLKRLKPGETISLNRRVGEAVDVVVNGQTLARGVLVIVDKETSQLGVFLTEVVGAGGAFMTPVASRR